MVAPQEVPVEVPNTPWLTVRQAAEYLQCCANVVRQLLHDGELKASKLGNSYRINAHALHQFLMRRNKIVPPYRPGSRPWVAARHARGRKKAS